MMNYTGTIKLKYLYERGLYRLRPNCLKAEQSWTQVWLTGGDALLTWEFIVLR